MEIRKYEINIFEDLNMFIVPNIALIPSKDPSFQIPEGCHRSANHSIEQGLRKMAKLNGREYDPNDPLIQVWFFTPKCRNFTDDHPHINMEGLNNQSYEIYLESRDYIPASYLKDVKEGDQLEIRLPIQLIDWDRDIHISGALEANITCSQNKSRYGGQGRFEDVLRDLIKTSRNFYESHK